MVKVTAIIQEALQEINAIAAGEAVSKEDLDFGLRKLNRMLGRWSNQKIKAMGNELLGFSAGGKSVYTFGPGGDFDVPQAPSKIVQCFFRQQDTDYAVTRVSASDYARIIDKDVQNSIPNIFWMNQGHPLKEVRFWPLPDAGEMFFMIPAIFDRISSVSKSIDIDEAYKDAIVLSLAISLAPSFGAEPSRTLQMEARDAVKVIRSINADAPAITATDEGASAESFDWRIGDV